MRILFIYCSGYFFFVFKNDIFILGLKTRIFYNYTWVNNLGKDIWDVDILNCFLFILVMMFYTLRNVLSEENLKNYLTYALQ